jgi:ABC-2 type transport system permease protein
LRSPDAVVLRRARLLPLLAKEVREALSGRALWTMLLILCPLVGYSFFQAVALYGEASSAARDSAALASGLSPLDGVLVPSFGAFYLAVTLLFPFVAIRTLGREKESGALRLLVQLPYRVSTLVGAKMTAVSAVWFIAVAPALSALAIWTMLGGHLYPPETLNLLFGHCLYGLLVGAHRALCRRRVRQRGDRRDRCPGVHYRLMGPRLRAGRATRRARLDRATLVDTDAAQF